MGDPVDLIVTPRGWPNDQLALDIQVLKFGSRNETPVPCSVRLIDRGEYNQPERQYEIVFLGPGPLGPGPLDAVHMSRDQLIATMIAMGRLLSNTGDGDET